MPGVKRKAPPSNAAPNKPSKAAAPQPRPIDSGSDDSASGDGSDDGEDFDDGDDLLAAAQNGDDADMYEDDEGGFEDLEAEGAAAGGEEAYEDDEGGFEDLEAGEDGEESEVDNQEDETMEDAAGEQAAQKRAGTGLYAMPTANEVNELRAHGEMFRDNVFRLQIDEMLPTIRPSEKRAAPVEAALRKLKELFDSLPEIEPRSAEKAERKLKGAKIPWPSTAPAGDHKYAFAAPSALHLVGSWPLKTAAVRPGHFDVDVAVVMPSRLFTAKDARAGRYAAKRAYYLAVLAAAVAKADLGFTPSYECIDDDARRPILVLTPTDISVKVMIRIHPSYEAGLFPAARLAPSAANLRSTAEEDQQPTPAYNGTLAADALQLPHLLYLHATAKGCAAFADATLLLKTWAFKRGFGRGAAKNNAPRSAPVGSASARFFLTMVLAYLLRGDAKEPNGKRPPKPRLQGKFSSYQLFRGVLDWLASAPWERVVRMRGDETQVRYEWHAPAFVDPSGTLNLVGAMPAATLAHLSAEAKASIAVLDANTDAFGVLFLHDRAQPAFVFDEVARLDVSAATTASEREGDLGASLARAQHIAQTIERALGTRAHYSTLLTQAESVHWEINAKRPALSDTLDVGIQLDPTMALRLVEHGPPPEDTEAAASFRAFWGPLAELRRFRDGRIVESVVWQSAGPFARWSIPRSIVKHVLSLHCGITEVEWLGEAFSGLLDVPEDVAAKAYLAPTVTLGFQPISAAFAELTKSLRGLDLPLSLVSVVPTAEALRSMSTFIPGALRLDALGTRVPDTASYLAVHDIILTLESSGRWPDDLASIQAMKMAFYSKIAELLPSAVPGARAAVVVDGDIATTSPLADQSALEMILPTGFAFRARIHHARERTLLDRILESRDELPKRKREARVALARYVARFEASQRHHAAVAALQTRFPALSEATRLLKRWVAAQLFSDVAPELLELVALHACLQPGHAPASGAHGFVRALQTLATWEWRDDPLLVAVSAAILAPEGATTPRFDAEQGKVAADALKVARGQDPSRETKTWLIATENDAQGNDFAAQGPSANGAHALQELAKLCCRVLGRGAELQARDIKSLFLPSLKHFDFLIHLDASVLSRYAEHVAYDEAQTHGAMSKPKSRFANLLDDVSKLGTAPRAGFDAGSEFVEMLRNLFGDTLRLYHDVHGGPVIGALWNPALREARPLKALLGFSSMPTEGGVKLNEAAVCEEIQRLGQGLVLRVETKQ